MRVLHLVKTSVGANWALRQMRELVALGVEVHVALPDDGPLVEGYRAAGITVHDLQCSLPMRQPRRWPALFAAFRALVERIDPDVIHSHFVGTTLTMRLALGRNHATPRLFQVPGPLHLEHAAFRRAEIASAGAADSWVGSCQWTCDRYRQSGVAADRVYLSYYGIDLDRFVRQPSGRLRAELEIAPEAKIVGMVAYLYAPKRYIGQRRGIKGHEDLLDAIALCRARGLDVHGVFVGGPWAGATGYEAAVKAYAAGRIGDAGHFLGTRSDVPDLYPDFDVAVHPSHSENLGGAGESLLLAVPTIATDVGGFPDLVKPGETGWLVPSRSPERLAEAITAALANPEHASELASNGRRLAERLIDIRETSRQIVDIYGRVIPVSPRSAA